MPAKEITPLVLDTLGIFGLNSQQSPTALPEQWLVKANNIIIDRDGKISNRKGFKQISEGLTSNINSIGAFDRGNGVEGIFVADSNKIYLLESTDYPKVLTEVAEYSTNVNSSSKGQFINFNSKFYFFANGTDPLVYNPGSSTFEELTDDEDYNPPFSYVDFDPNCGTAAFARLWAGGVSKSPNVLYYSDILIGNNWLPFGTDVTASYNTQATCEEQGNFWDGVNNVCYSGVSGAGMVDLGTVWGSDRIVAIQSFMDTLVIFGTENIVIFSNPQDPFNMEIYELIRGVGLKGRDTVQAIGDDLVFLSNSGLRSLSRTVTSDGKMPLRELSINIKKELNQLITGTSPEDNFGVYCLCGGFYLLSFPSRKLAYYFDFSSINQDGTPRITKFDLSAPDDIIGIGNSELHAGVSTINGDLYLIRKGTFGITPATRYGVCLYTGDKDTYVNVESGNEVDATFPFSFKTTWIDFGNQAVSKIFKKFIGIFDGGKNATIDLTWYSDYNPTGTTISDIDLEPTAVGTDSIWGTAVWGTATWGATYLPTEYKYSMSKTGKTLQLEISGVIDDYPLGINNITIHAKMGKIL